MSVSGNSFLKMAEWIHEQGSCNEEIKFRTYVNRAYYSIFHVAKAFLLDKFLLKNPRANHREVIERLKLEDEHLGNELMEFFQQRKEADYILTRDLSEKRAERLVRDMKRFIDDLNEDN